MEGKTGCISKGILIRLAAVAVAPSQPDHPPFFKILFSFA
jgi:hypothetical protein